MTYTEKQIELMDKIHDVSLEGNGSTGVQIHGNGLIDIYFNPFPDMPDLFKEQKIILTTDELLKIVKLGLHIIPGFKEEIVTILEEKK